MPSNARSRARKPRGVTRKSQPRPDIPDYVTNAANVFAAQRALPAANPVRTPMRDLKGWLAGLLRVEVLPLWVRSASALCFNLKNAQDLKYRSEHFTRTVLKIILDRDRERSQSIDTTLRRQCCIDREKSGLTFMKILNAICAAFDFSGSTSRCHVKSHLGINSPNVHLWAVRYERFVSALKDIRICVKNDSASADLVSYITSPEWGHQLAMLLSKDHHSICVTAPASAFDEPCEMVTGGEEMRTLSTAICQAVVSASPATPAGVPIPGIFFSNTRANDPLCMASLLMPYSPNVAITLVDKTIGLDPARFNTRGNQTMGMPIEIHREMRVFEAIRRRMANNKEAVSQVMAAFAKVFKFNRPPLLWWPEQHEIEQITQLAVNENAVAMTVWGLMMEHMAWLGRGCNRARALEMYQKSGDNGDLFGLTHAGKILLEGGGGVERNPKKAEAFLWHGANKRIRGAMSVLGDLYCGGGEPEIARNDIIAAKMYEAASDLGCSKASRKLATLVEGGLGGVPKDQKRAEKLRNIAARKENRKRQQKAHLAPAEPICDIPDPDIILGSLSACSSSSELSAQLADNPPQVASQFLEDNSNRYGKTPMREDEQVGRRRYRECEVEIEPMAEPPPMGLGVNNIGLNNAMSAGVASSSTIVDAIDDLLDLPTVEYNVDAECANNKIDLNNTNIQPTPMAVLSPVKPTPMAFQPTPIVAPTQMAAPVHPMQFTNPHAQQVSMPMQYNNHNINMANINMRYNQFQQIAQQPRPQQFEQYAQYNPQFLATNADCVPKRQRTGYQGAYEVWR